MARLAGTLEKKGGFRHNWLPRHFQLHTSALQYFDKEPPDNNLKGSIEMATVTMIRESEAPNRHPHEMELITDERTFRIRAASEGEMVEWIHAIRTLIPAATARRRLQSRMQEMNGFYDGQASQSVLHLVHDRWDESWADGRDMDGEELLAELAAEHRANGTQFNDDRFPANDSSLFMRGSSDTGSRPSAAGVLRHDQKPFLQSRSHEVEWKSPSEILDVNAKPVIFSGGIEPDDIHQGQLGNCYLLAAMAACASNTRLIEDLIVEDHFSDVGLIGVKFFKEGRWVTVVVDAMLPCIPYGENGWCPIFCRPSDEIVHGAAEKELWCCYMEKAFAKLFGSYESLHGGGDCSDALNYLTGGLTSNLPPLSLPSSSRNTGAASDQRQQDTRTTGGTSAGSGCDSGSCADGDACWEAMVTALDNGAFASTSCRAELGVKALETVGLLHGHAYTVLHAVETTRTGKRR